MQDIAAQYSNPNTNPIANNSQLTTAGQQAITAQGNANNSGTLDLTLPQLLQTALTGPQNPGSPGNSVYASNLDQTDMPAYLGILGNAATNPANQSAPSMVTSGPGSQSTVPLGPDAQMTLIQNSLKNAAAPVNSDTFAAGLENQGVLNVISKLAAAHATQTQQLTNQAQLAQQNYQQILSRLSLSAQTALSAAGLAEQEKEFSNSPTQLALSLAPVAQKAAQSTSDFGSLYSQWMGNPAYITSQGTRQNAAQTLYDEWSKAHPGSTPDSGTMKELLDMGINTKNIYAQPEHILSQLTAPLMGMLKPVEAGAEAIGANPENLLSLLL
jgi:hypothetical protein